MSDRCYMQLTCRRQDKKRFEDLGFVAQCWANPDKTTFTVEMVDGEADWAHANELPKDVAYVGFNGPGGNFGDGVFACDGKVYAEVDTGHNGGFVVEWDESKGQPTAGSLRAVRSYLTIRARVLELFKT